MAKVSEVELDVRLLVGSVRPGDTLVVAKHGPVSAQEAARIKEHIEARLPDVSVLVIEADGLAVYRR